MTRRGVTLLEVTIAGVIFVVIILIVSGLFIVADKAYRTEIPLRDIQVRCQTAVDGITRELGESSNTTIWMKTVTNEALPADADEALVFLTARDPSGQFVKKAGTLEPSWQMVIAYVPLVNGEGVVELKRFEFGAGSVPSSLTGVSANISTSATQVTLQWTEDATSNLVSPPGAVAVSRQNSVVHATRLSALEVINPSMTSDTDDDFGLGDGSDYAANVWKVSLSVTAELPDKDFNVTVSSSAQGRN